jgi:cytochrome P450
VAQTASFFSAGSDTSALPMMYTLYELARHPEIQDKLRNEILKKLNESDGNVTYQMVRYRIANIWLLILLSDNMHYSNIVSVVKSNSDV